MSSLGNFPFGQPVNKLVQSDRTPKKVFVLGVYASAVHAIWKDKEGKIKVNAFAVASEPHIFWRGEDAKDIIDKIHVPKDCGTLEPADQKFNGPSGQALDNKILIPLGLTRNDAWLCDLVPYSCINSGQDSAVKRSYSEFVKNKLLPEVSTPHLPNPLVDSARRADILQEIMESKANILILLGDQPIKWFLHAYLKHWKSLSDFGTDEKTYGNRYPVKIGEHEIQIIPLAHPRQIAKLGLSSQKWYKLHNNWIKNVAPKLLKDGASLPNTF